MKRIYLILLLAITGGVFCLMAFLSATVHDLTNSPNGFTRTPSPHTVIKLAGKQFDQPLRDIAGVADNNIYIATATPGVIIRTNNNLGADTLMHLPVTAIEKLASNFTTALVYPKLYIYGTNVPCVVEFDLATQQQTVFKVNRAYSRCIMISPHTAILRGFNSTYNDENLRRLNLLSGASVEENDITDKTGAGGYATDGLLNYDQQTHTLVFNHFYSNRILYLDTNLQLLHTGAAIDTFSHYTAHAKAITKSNGVMFTLTAPPKLLSMHSCVNNGRLFICSRVKADNESPDQFRNHAVVDIYDIATHHYTGSLYVPVENGKRLLKFGVYNDLLIALFNNKVVVYRIQ